MSCERVCCCNYSAKYSPLDCSSIFHVLTSFLWHSPTNPLLANYPHTQNFPSLTSCFHLVKCFSFFWNVFQLTPPDAPVPSLRCMWPNLTGGFPQMVCVCVSPPLDFWKVDIVYRRLWLLSVRAYNARSQRTVRLTKRCAYTGVHPHPLLLLWGNKFQNKTKLDLARRPTSKVAIPPELARRPASKAVIPRSDDPAIKCCLDTLYLGLSCSHQLSYNYGPFCGHCVSCRL